MITAGKKNLSHVVIGSGPAGVACAHALLQRGARVTLIDAGVSLEKSRADLVARMSKLPPKDWNAEMLKDFKSGMVVRGKKIPTKLAYGSDYPYREADIHIPANYEGVASIPSLARGGFSTIWGASIMPYSEKDVEGWPINISHLAQHYAAVSEIIGVAGAEDGMAELFPFYAKPQQALALSKQAKILQAHIKKNREPLRKAGIHAGQARVAIKSGESGCVYCGLCMYGCPYSYIYSSEQTLNILQQNPNFTYITDTIVTHVSESDESASIRGYNRITRISLEIFADRLYIGAGTVATAGIVLRSLSFYNQPVHLKDSQYFLFPLMLMRGAKDVRTESLYALSQMFIDIFDPCITSRSVHLQVYSYNDLVGEAVRQSFGPAAGMLDRFIRSFENRILPVLGFLHSDDSSQIEITLKQGNPDHLNVQAKLNPKVHPTINRVMRKLLRHGWKLGAWPFTPMLQVFVPGRGSHSGSSFPMRANPDKLETDTLGRLPDWKRIHIVDASVLPDIPATQLTFSVMANAHRIGWDAVNL